MQIARNDLDTGAGPSDWFTGDVYIDTITAPAKPGENHWHGAAPNRFMTHIAMQQADEHGNVVTWGDHVTDADYAAALAIPE